MPCQRCNTAPPCRRFNFQAGTWTLSCAPAFREQTSRSRTRSNNLTFPIRSHDNWGSRPPFLSLLPEGLNFELNGHASVLKAIGVGSRKDSRGWSEGLAAAEK